MRLLVAEARARAKMNVEIELRNLQRLVEKLKNHYGAAHVRSLKKEIQDLEKRIRKLEKDA